MLLQSQKCVFYICFSSFKWLNNEEFLFLLWDLLTDTYILQIIAWIKKTILRDAERYIISIILIYLYFNVLLHAIVRYISCIFVSSSVSKYFVNPVTTQLKIIRSPKN